jgi:hypothetical protein
MKKKKDRQRRYGEVTEIYAGQLLAYLYQAEQVKKKLDLDDVNSALLLMLFYEVMK